MQKVVIFGRPNVGKSALFNRLTESRQSIVLNQPGVTRDRIKAQAQWFLDRPFLVEITDTGGITSLHLEKHEKDFFASLLQEQVQVALKESDVILFVVDGRAGLQNADEILFQQAAQKGLFEGKALILVVNKIDDYQHEPLAADFYTLQAKNLVDLLTVSAEHGRGIEDLKEKVVTWGKFESSTQEKRDLVQVAVVGRPNVGKSSFINALACEERCVVSSQAGTTRDFIEVPITLKNSKQLYLFTDTAGVRRKSKTEQGTEVLSVIKTKQALKKASIAILMLDAEQGFVEQDEKVASLILDAKCGVIIVINKWDTQQNLAKKTMLKELHYKMGFLTYAPVFFVSSLKKTGLSDLAEVIAEISKSLQVKIPTHEFTEWVREESKIHNPRNAKFFLCHQTRRNPPAFVLHVNDPEKIDFSLKRHLVNAMRTHFGLVGIPIDLQLKKAFRRSLPRKTKVSGAEDRKQVSK